MKEIKLTQNKIALVDDDMFDYLNEWKWHAAKSKEGRWYAVRQDGKRPFRKLIRMHRVVLNAPDGVDVDHKKQEDTLNNQRSNLRLCNQSQNSANVGKRTNNTSGFKGVHWSEWHERWISTIMVSGRRIYLGSYIEKEDAALAYDVAAVTYFGEFAKTNLSEGNYETQKH